MSSKRIAQVNELIKQELGYLFVREIEFPKGMIVTITRVESSPELNDAEVYITVLPQNRRGTALETIKKKRGSIQHLLIRRLSMRSVPQLRYAIDTETEKADELEALFDAVKKEL